MIGAMEIAIMVVRFVQFCTAMVLFGAPVFVLATVLCHAEAGDTGAELIAWLRRWSLAAAVMALVSALAWLDVETAIWGGGWDNAVDPSTVAAALFDTEFGRVWQWHIGLEAALVALLLVPRLGAWRLALVALLGAAHVAGIAWAGHGAMGMSPLQLPVQAVHVLAGSLWLGSLPALFHLLRAARSRPAAAAAARKMLPLYSRAGYGVVAVLILSGIGNSVFLVDSATALVTTAYGVVLLLKLVLVAAMVGVALGNRISLAPSIVADADAAPVGLLARRVVVEQGLALLVLVAVSVLGMLPPAMTMDM